VHVPEIVRAFNHSGHGFRIYADNVEAGLVADAANPFEGFGAQAIGTGLSDPGLAVARVS